MRNRLLTGIFAVLLLTAGVGPVAGQPTDEAVTSAREAAQDWLARLDADEYEATWTTASSYFKSQLTTEAWVDQVTQAHQTLGALDSRSEISVEVTTSVPKAPDGTYVVFQYRTTYGEKETVETVTMKKDADEWRMAGYYVKPARP